MNNSTIRYRCKALEVTEHYGNASSVLGRWENFNSWHWRQAWMRIWLTFITAWCFLGSINILFNKPLACFRSAANVCCWLNVVLFFTPADLINRMILIIMSAVFQHSEPTESAHAGHRLGRGADYSTSFSGLCYRQVFLWYHLQGIWLPPFICASWQERMGSCGMVASFPSKEDQKRHDRQTCASQED